MMGSTLLRLGFRTITLLSYAATIVHGHNDVEATVFERDAPEFVARILPLGASIVWGYNTPEGNGFRLFLRDELTSNGWNVNMVGSKQHGTMTDNDVEAHPGDTIDEIHQASLNSIVYQPNIIVINAGNNDCHLHINIADAGTRINAMVDELFGKIPGVTIVLSTLVLSTNADVEEDRGSLNDQIRGLVAARRQRKEKIVLAEMTGAGDTFVEVADLTSDGVHPNDGGAKKMGHTFFQAILQANAEGLITKPNESSAVSGEEVQSVQAAPTTTTTPSPTTSSTVIPKTSTTSTTPIPTPTSSSSTSSSSTPSTTSTSLSSSKTATSASGSGNLGALLHTKVSSTVTSYDTTTSTPAMKPSIVKVTAVTSSTSTSTVELSTVTTATVQSSPTSKAVLQNAGMSLKYMSMGGTYGLLACISLSVSLAWLL